MLGENTENTSRKKRAKTTKEKKRIFIVTAIIITLFVALITAPVKMPPIFIFNHTESVPTGWYIMMPVTHLEDGDIVGFDVPDEIKDLALERGWVKENDIMLKKVGAMEGETYSINNQQFYVKDKYIGQVIAKDGQGRPMPATEETATGTHTVEKGCFLPITEHPFSFDGRYYGTISLQKIRFRAIKINPFS